MKGMIIRIIAAIFLFAGFSSIMPQDNIKTEELISQGKLLALKAYLGYNQDLMLEAESVFSQAYKQDNNNASALYHITYVHYKLLEMSLREKGSDAFNKYYDTAIADAQKLAETKDWQSEGKVLLSAIYMMKIADSPLTAVALSPKISGLLDEAEQADPANPRTYIIRGTMKFNTPKNFGGSYESAAENFRKAVRIFEKQDTTLSSRPSWGYPESLAWLGRSLEELENFESAKFTYTKALSVNPEFAWVKYVLLPNLGKKMSAK